MPVRYRLDSAKGLIRGEAWGIVTERDLIAAIASVVLENDGAAIGKDVLTVFAPQASLHELDLGTLERIKGQADASKRTSPGGKFRSALVASDPDDAGILRLWKALWDADPAAERDVRVFLTEAEAIAWLESGIDT